VPSVDWRALRNLGFNLKFRVPLNAQVAELVDALVSGISGAIRGGSSPLLGTNLSLLVLFSLDWQREKNKLTAFRR
jgi:hypothetical protein